MTDYNTKLEIELIKKDVAGITVLCEKIDKTIEKLQDISVTLSRMVSLLEQRLDNQEKNTKELRVEFVSETRDIHRKIDGIQKELAVRIDSIENSILDEIQRLRVEMQGKLATDHDASSLATKTLTERLSSVEKWRYILTGAIFVAGWILSRMTLDFDFFSK